jgi:ribosomal protein S18 acetylase RimI-like enzyme
MTETCIRQATAADAPAIADLLVDCWRTAYRGIVSDSYLDALDPVGWAVGIQQSIDTGAEETWVWETEGDVAGVVTVGACRDDDCDPGETGEIWALHVSPRHWREGIGSRLVRCGEGILAARGLGDIRAWVFEANAAALRFYSALGFEPDGHFRTRTPRGIPLRIVRLRTSTFLST